MTAYKQTELGLIPSDWEVVELEKVVKLFSSGSTPSRAQPQFYRGNNLWITSGELNYCTINDTIEKISDIAIEKANLKKHPVGTFLMAITGLEATGTRGSCAITGKIATTNQSCMAIYPNEKLKTEFLYQWYVFNGDWLALKYCQGTKQLSYTAGLLKKLPIKLPKSTTEQTAIATALSDTDALLAELEKLLAKKQAIKTATMQQLLTGKTRLPEFANRADGTPKGSLKTEWGDIPEDWEVVALGSVAFIKTGSKNNQDKKENGQYPFFVRSATVEKINSYSYDCEAILIPGEGGIGSIFHYIDGKFDAHQRVYVIRDFKNVIGKFVFYSLKQNFGKHALENTVKATVDSLRLPTFQKFNFAIPKSTTEQTAIAQILGDMDSEITALQARIEKVREIKQGMMQNLLTGKIRLPF